MIEGIENLPGEEWKDVPGYEGLYRVSNMGRVLNMRTNKLLKPQFPKGTRNITVIRLAKENNVQNINIFTLIYKVFISDVTFSDYIVPANGDFTDIRVSNLKRISRSSHNLYTDKAVASRDKRRKYHVDDIFGNYKILQVKTKSQPFILQCLTCLEKFTTGTVHGNHSCKCKEKYNVGDMVGKYKILRIYSEKSYNIDVCVRFADIECTTCKEIVYHIELNKLTSSNHACACLEGNFKNRYTHDGRSSNSLYKRWCNMRRRCYDIKYPLYKFYGAKGVFICDLWLHDSISFFTWYNSKLPKAIETYGEVEYKNTSTKIVQTKISFDVDRINPNGPYAPWNCQLIPSRINRSNNYKIKQREKYPESGLLRIQTDAELRKQRRTWYKEALERGEIDAKYYRKQITRRD